MKLRGSHFNEMLCNQVSNLGSSLTCLSLVSKPLQARKAVLSRSPYLCFPFLVIKVIPISYIQASSSLYLFIQSHR